MTKKPKTGYDADDLTALEGLDAVRKRPGMYIGELSSRGMTHLAYEILDNAVDEALAGHCNKIWITFHEDGSLEVADNGRGIPVDINEKSGLSGVILVYTKLHAGGKFGGSSYAKGAGGLHGVGASVVNALSERVDVLVHRDGIDHEISFQRGVPGFFTGKGPKAKFAPSNDIHIGKLTKRQGTVVRFWPDYQIFQADASMDYEAILARARQTAFLVPSVEIEIRDKRNPEKPSVENFHFAGGVKSMVTYLAQDNPICDTLYLTGSGTYLETVPVIDEKGHLNPQEVERTVDIQIALVWGNGYDGNVQSFANVVRTPNGGTHVKGLERGLIASIRKGYEGTRILKTTEEPPTLDDIREGLTAVISIGAPEVQFLGQTKDELATVGVQKVVQDITIQGIEAWMDGRKKAQARLVLEKIANASRTRVASRSSREASRRKTAIEGAAMPAKLVDCAQTGVENSELFLVEGDSALGSARAARDSRFQALLPLRGKILNVQKASLADMLNNAECAAIIQSIGAGSGKTFDITQMRYHKILLMADADVDGSHIRVLLMVLFAKYMRPVITEGRLYAAMPPLHKIEVMGKGGEVIYTYTNDEMLATVAKLEKAGKKIKSPIQRFKGLGEMSSDEIAETTIDPHFRSLRRITMDDIAEAEEILQLLMGDEVAPRRNWIIENSDIVDREALDA